MKAKLSMFVTEVGKKHFYLCLSGQIRVGDLPIVFFQGQGKDKDVNSKSASDLSEDLFKVHDFDVKIDLQVPSSGRCCS